MVGFVLFIEREETSRPSQLNEPSGLAGALYLSLPSGYIGLCSCQDGVENQMPNFRNHKPMLGRYFLM
jgi:hypothetical protein